MLTSHGTPCRATRCTWWRAPRRPRFRSPYARASCTTAFSRAWKYTQAKPAVALAPAASERFVLSQDTRTDGLLELEAYGVLTNGNPRSRRASSTSVAFVTCMTCISATSSSRCDYWLTILLGSQRVAWVEMMCVVDWSWAAAKGEADERREHARELVGLRLSAVKYALIDYGQPDRPPGSRGQRMITSKPGLSAAIWR